MITLTDITVAFGGVKPLDRLTLSLSAPISGLIGPNGAGKTTLLNVLSGFLTPRSGTITAFGTPLTGMRPAARHAWGLSRSFQTPQIAGDLTVADNIRVAQDHRPPPANRPDLRLEALLDRVGLTAKANVPGDALDGFDRRLVELARCMASDPRLVLLDEPAAGLGADERSQLMGLITGLPVDGHSMVLIIDHDVDLIASICGALAVLDFGKLVASGPTRDVLADPKVKAAYLGEDA
jgi:branched-chain amino acid transport system ATP-binding protein